MWTRPHSYRPSLNLLQPSASASRAAKFIGSTRGLVPGPSALLSETFTSRSFTLTVNSLGLLAIDRLTISITLNFWVGAKTKMPKKYVKMPTIITPKKKL